MQLLCIMIGFKNNNMYSKGNINEKMEIKISWRVQ